MVYEALRAGHGFLGYEQPAGIAEFTFLARSGDAQATMGEELRLDLEQRHLCALNRVRWSVT